jgi:hypothetical protein
VAAREEGGEQVVDDGLLADDALLDLGADGAAGARDLGDGLEVFVGADGAGGRRGRLDLLLHQGGLRRGWTRNVPHAGRGRYWSAAAPPIHSSTFAFPMR